MVKKVVQKIGYCALFLLIFNFFEHFSHQKTDGFSIHRIQFSAPTAAPSHPPSEAPLFASILNQSFHYLDCGNQCFVFLSDDGEYVLKFFKYARSPVPHALTKIPLLNRFKPFRPHRFKKVVQKRQRDFQGYQLAYDRFKQETGLITLSLKPSHRYYPVVSLIDKLHIPHLLDLNTVPFVLQKKTVPIYFQIEQWIDHEEFERAKDGIKSLIDLLKKRIDQQLMDDDVHFYSNFGFIGDTAIQVDPGHFTAGSSTHPEIEIKALAHELISWCEKNAPQLIPVIENETCSP